MDRGCWRVKQPTCRVGQGAEPPALRSSAAQLNAVGCQMGVYVMPKYWKKPYYELRAASGAKVLIDVTSSASAGLGPSSVVVDKLIPFLKSRRVERVLDFGAGALRHTFPLLDAGFQVCAVEFEEGFTRPVAKKALAKASRHHNFSALVWPRQFISDKRMFDAALLAFVIQIMPIPKERTAVIRHIYKKLNRDAYLFYAARFGQVSASDESRKVSDGFYRWPDREAHSFYREFTTEQTHKMFEDHGFHRIRSLSERGTQQMQVYSKGKATWA